MGWIKRAASMLLIGVLVGPVGATTTEIEDVECPVCANKFRALGWASTNSVGGQDRDFLRHAAGGQVFLITCWTCPKCRYTGYSGDFSGDEMPQALIQRLKKDNPLKATEPIDPKLQDSWEIPAWVRFDLLVQTRKARRGHETRRVFDRVAARRVVAALRDLGFDRAEEAGGGAA